MFSLLMDRKLTPDPGKKHGTGKSSRVTSSFRVSWIFFGMAVLALGLGLNYHKDLIQYININSIVSEHMDGRLIPHRINREGRLRAVLDGGIRSFEMDLLFRVDEQDRFFEVGHDEANATGVELDLFLEILKTFQVGRIWMDVKNLRDDNVDDIATELERLDSIYGIKKIAIIESDITTSGFQKLSHSGFHTSYYLPTQRIVGLLDQNDSDMLRAEALRLKHQIESQSVSAVSFNLSLYPFVKDYLEPVVSSTIVYHVWDSIKLWERGAIGKLKSSMYFSDDRVKTILYGYWGSGCWLLPAVQSLQ